MKKILPALLLALLSLYGCKKDKKTPPPVVTTGSINGIISPANAATSVTALAVGGKATTYSASPDKNGSFKLTGLPAGAYTLSVIVAGGYTAPASQTDTVTIGHDTDAGTIMIIQMPGSISGSISPVRSAILLRITNTAGGVAFDAMLTPDATGSFGFTNVPPGSYTLTPTAAPGYSAPPDQTLIVKAGQNTSTGKLKFDRITLPGSISGKVSPADQVLNVAVTTGVTPQFTVVPHTDGTFKIKNLPAGKYHLTVTPVAGSALYEYSNLGVMVEAQNTDIGTADLRTSAQGYTPFCTVDGTTFAAYAFVSRYNGSTLTFAGPIVLFLGGYNVAVRLYNVNGVGEYTCNSTTTSSMIISNAVGFWSSLNAGGSATVKITAFDPVTHHFSGTFSGVLTAGADASNTKTITNGVLDDYQYQTP